MTTYKQQKSVCPPKQHCIIIITSTKHSLQGATGLDIWLNSLAHYYTYVDVNGITYYVTICMLVQRAHDAQLHMDIINNLGLINKA